MNTYQKNKALSVALEPRYLHMSWCLKNDIRIYFQPENNTSGRIIIEEEGVPFVSEEKYKSDDKLWRRKKVKGEPPQRTYSERIYELYTIKYNEYNGKQKEKHSGRS